MDKLRSYKVLLDGTEVARIKRGETRTIDATAGHHEVHLTLDWCRSRTLPLDLGAGDELQLRCWPNARPFTVLYWVTARRSDYIGVEVVNAGA